MLEGREITVLMLSEVLGASYSQRIDSYFFQKEFLIEPFENKFYQLNTICNIRSGTTPSIRDENLKEGIILLKTDNIRNGVLNFTSENDFFFIDKETNQTMKATELQNDDVLINIVGATTDVIGRCSLLSQDFPKANITQAMAFLRIENDFKAKFNSHFLFAFLTSKLGHKQIRRIARPTGQFNMNLQEVGSIKIPIVSFEFQTEIKEILLKSEELKSQSQTLYTEAENLLLESLGLKDFDFEKEKVSTNIKSFSSSFLSTGRLDAEYYQPKYEVLENKIKSYKGGFCKIKDVFSQNKSSFEKNKLGFNYIEIGDISVSDGKTSFNFVETENLPANAKIKIKKGDLLVSKVRPNRGAISIIDFEQEDLICSGAFTVLRENKNSPIRKETLQVFLRMEMIKDLLLKYNCGTSYPVIKDEDILDFEIPLFDLETQTLISSKIQASFRLKSESEALLSLAKEVVEIAIEISEEKALQKIQDMTQKIYVLPAKIDLHYFSNLLLAIETQQAPKITLDWSSCVSIDKQSYCSILHLRDIIAIKNAELSHLGEDTITYQKVKHIFEYDLNNNSDIFSGIFISPIQSEELILQHQRLMENFYSKHTKGYDLTSLGNIFQELYMNVCQHSEVSKGYIFMANPDENGNCEMIFSDKGIGIVDKICNFFVDETFETDAKVIEYATQKGVTTRSQTQNQGKGLDNLVVQAESLKASLCIYSKQGIFKKIIKDITLLDNPLLYKGTLIYLSFNICNLPLQEDDNLVGEL